MTKDEALKMLEEYVDVAWTSRMIPRLEVDMSGLPGPFADVPEQDAVWWLGYAQGVMVAYGVYTKAEILRHRSRGWVRGPGGREAK